MLIVLTTCGKTSISFVWTTYNAANPAENYYIGFKQTEIIFVKQNNNSSPNKKQSNHALMVNWSNKTINFLFYKFFDVKLKKSPVHVQTLYIHKIN